MSRPPFKAVLRCRNQPLAALGVLALLVGLTLGSTSATEQTQGSVSGAGDSRLRERMIDRLRDSLRRAMPLEQELFQLPIGIDFERIDERRALVRSFDQLRGELDTSGSMAAAQLPCLTSAAPS